MYFAKKGSKPTADSDPVTGFSCAFRPCEYRFVERVTLDSVADFANDRAAACITGSVSGGAFCFELADVDLAEL